MNRALLLFMLLLVSLTLNAQMLTRHVKIMDSTNKPIDGASLEIGGISGLTNTNGQFLMPKLSSGVYQMRISYQGYQMLVVKLIIPLTSDTIFRLNPLVKQLNEVVISTGYYNQSVEKTTGSFLQIKSSELQRNASSGIVQRLEGIVPSLNFDRRSQQEPNGEAKIRVRGPSTINGEQDPLIVLDNFPFYGDINLINPDQIESVTVLKDAAAASIWGAKAGNGVIVITTKQAALHQNFKLSFNAVGQVKSKPNFLASPNYISSAGYLDIEQQLFANNYYLSSEQSTGKTALSPFVEQLIAHRDGLITDEALSLAKAGFAAIDVRKEAMNYLYQQASAQRYNLNLSNGGIKSSWMIGLGYDKDDLQLVQNKSDRLGLNMNLRLMPINGLTIGISSNLTLASKQRHDIDFNNLGTVSSKKAFPYTQLRDQDGKNSVVSRLYSDRYKRQMIGKVPENWDYVPLDELSLKQIHNLNSNVRLLGNINYQLLPSLSFDVKYQFQEDRLEIHNLRDRNTFEVRNYINQYTQANGVSVFPVGGILYQEYHKVNSYNFRVQANYNKMLQSHQLAALAGYERNSLITKMDGFGRYGYDDNSLTYVLRPDLNTRYPTYPTGNLQLPLPDNKLEHLTDNYLSYFANLSYTYKNRYTFTGSGRIDASNLFGVDFNQKSVPLWSVGAAWSISQEAFWQSKAISKLRLQATYGYSGNIDKSVTAFTTASYGVNQLTGLRFANITSPANPNLKWEKVATGNLSLIAEGAQGKWHLKLEYFNKRAEDLIGDIPIDPTVGVISGLASSYKLNYAQLATNGIELELALRVIDRKDFKWNIGFNVASNRSKVLAYDYLEDGYLGVTSGQTASITIGKPLDAIYSIPWHGLDGRGNPKVFINNVDTTYNAYVAQLKRSQLVYHGSSLPTVSGNLVNTLVYKRFQFSVQALFKSGYYFRKKTIDYTSLFTNQIGHQDYNLRWQKPGDELLTNVPALSLVNNTNRDLVYVNSEVNVLKGDHIRLKDINFSYLLNTRKSNHTANIFLNIDNVALVWVANKEKLDPDFPSALYPNLTTYSIGFKLNL